MAPREQQQNPGCQEEMNTPQQHWEHTAATMRMSCHTEASLSDRCRGLSDRKKRELGALDYFVSARTNKD